MSADYDVLIVGGGPVGATLALALRGSGLAVGLLEARAERAAQEDLRPIALSHGSRLILERLGVWERLAQPTPIQRIHVSQQGGFGRVELDAAEGQLPALGYVLDYGRLAAALAEALEGLEGCRRIRSTVSGLESRDDGALVRFDVGAGGTTHATARLLAVADGGALPVATTYARDYRQAAVSALVSSSVPHQNVAFERFTPSGPLAMLPSGTGYAVVWTTAPERARELCELPETDFLAQLQRDFGSRRGTFSRATKRAWFPLRLKVAHRIAQSGVVALGNAAQTLHPVAGQGLNLGLRDAWELAETVQGCDRAEIGRPRQLGAYAARRRLDRGGGIAFTDGLVRLFSGDFAPLRIARGVGLAVLGAAPPLKDFVLRRMTFGTRG